MSVFSDALRDVAGLPPTPAPVDKIPDFEGDCRITVLGVEWLALFGYSATPEDGGYVIEIEACSIQPHSQRLHCPPIPVDYAELPKDCQEDIEAAALAARFEDEDGDDFDPT